MVKKLLMGNEAFAYAALEAGVRVVAGYPGTPSTELIETIAAERAVGRAQGVEVEWSTNEKVALELLAGASLAGARCLFTCKQVGLNVASDALLSLNYVGIKGGLVLFVADDPGPISSQTEQDTRRFAQFAKVPVLDPSTIEQGYDMMKAAFELSERYATPVIVRSSTRICHASSFVDVPVNTQAFEVEGFERSSRWVIFPRRAYEAHGEINERLCAIADEYAQEPWVRFNPIEKGGVSSSFSREGEQGGSLLEAKRVDSGKQGTLGIVAGGVSASYVQEALRMIERQLDEKGKSLPAYRFMQIGTVYPFPKTAVQTFVEGLEAVLVFEELDYVIEDELQKLCGEVHGSFEVYGKLTGHTRDRGENTVDDTRERLEAFFGCSETAGEETSEKNSAKENKNLLEPIPALPVRAPVLCAGCPHRGSFYAVKQALKSLKQEALFCGDIGCYTLGNALPLDAVDTCLCMGAGIAMAQGFSVVEPGKKYLAFVGDSTFFASALPGLVNAIYNEHDITVIVLDNSLTAMTGAQPNPGTGDTLMGHHHAGIDIELVLRALGFTHVYKANPFEFTQSVEAAKSALEVKEPSALVYQGPCITLTKPKDPVILTNRCTGCKKCIKEIGCPAIGFESIAKKVVINADLCTGCGLCVAVCSFSALSLEESSSRREDAQTKGDDTHA